MRNAVAALVIVTAVIFGTIIFACYRPKEGFKQAKPKAIPKAPPPLISPKASPPLISPKAKTDVITVEKQWTSCKKTKDQVVCGNAFQAFFDYAKENPKFSDDPKLQKSGVMEMWYFAQGMRDVGIDGIDGVIESMKVNYHGFSKIVGHQ